MDILKQLVSGLKIDSIIDEVVTSKEEKAQLKIELTKVLANSQIEIEREVTKRAISDNTHGSWLSRNIRSGLLACAFVMMCLFALMDSGLIPSIDIKDHYITMIGDILEYGMAFYYGSNLIKTLSHSPAVTNLTKKEK